jgi:hypothetical protein
VEQNLHRQNPPNNLVGAIYSRFFLRGNYQRESLAMKVFPFIDSNMREFIFATQRKFGEDSLVPFEEPKQYKCEICDRITTKPIILGEFSNPKRCEDFCCGGPAKEYISP